jgi:hypothetical protein
LSLISIMYVPRPSASFWLAIIPQASQRIGHWTLHSS